MQKLWVLMLPAFLHVKDGRVIQQGARTRVMKPVPVLVLSRVPTPAIVLALPVRGSPVMTRLVRPPVSKGPVPPRAMIRVRIRALQPVGTPAPIPARLRVITPVVLRVTKRVKIVQNNFFFFFLSIIL